MFAVKWHLRPQLFPRENSFLEVCMQNLTLTAINAAEKNTIPC